MMVDRYRYAFFAVFLYLVRVFEASAGDADPLYRFGSRLAVSSLGFSNLPVGGT